MAKATTSKAKAATDERLPKIISPTKAVDPTSRYFIGPPTKGNTEESMESVTPSDLRDKVTPPITPQAAKTSVKAGDYQSAAALIRETRGSGDSNALYNRYKAGVASGKAFDLDIDGSKFSYAATPQGSSSGKGRVGTASGKPPISQGKLRETFYGNGANHQRAASTTKTKEVATKRVGSMADSLSKKSPVKSAPAAPTTDDNGRDSATIDQYMAGDPDLHQPALSRAQAERRLAIEKREASNAETNDDGNSKGWLGVAAGLAGGAALAYLTRKRGGIKRLPERAAQGLLEESEIANKVVPRLGAGPKQLALKEAPAPKPPKMQMRKANRIAPKKPKKS